MIIYKSNIYIQCLLYLPKFLKKMCIDNQNKAFYEMKKKKDGLQSERK